MLDYLIKQGLLIDGTGEKSYVADIAIDKGKIAKIGSNLALEAKEVRNAKGMVVSPGLLTFILIRTCVRLSRTKTPKQTLSRHNS